MDKERFGVRRRESGYVRRRAGAGTAGASGAITTLSALGPWAALAIPVFLLLGKIFKGADPRQVPAAKIQQMFEISAINFTRIVKAGYASKDEAWQWQTILQQKGIEFYDDPSVVLGDPEVRGKAAMLKRIREEMARVKALPDRKLIAVDLAAARRLYIPVDDPNKWYPETLEAARQITDDFLKALPSRSVVQAVGSAAAAVASVSGSPAKLAGLGLGAFLVVGLLRRFL